MKKRLSFIGSPKHLRRAPALVLLLLLLFTFTVTFYLYKTNRASSLTHFTNATLQTQDNIHDNLDAFITLLRGTGALFAANEQTTQEEFHAYVQRLLLSEHYRGIQGIGFASRVAKAEKDSFINQVRQQGKADFTIFPEGDREEYFPIVYLEPPDRRNQAAIGYDMFSEASRHAAMTSAMTNGIDTSSKVTLIQEIGPAKQAGFLIYLGLYRGGGFPATIAERREKLTGFVYIPFRADDFFLAIFSPEEELPIHVEIYDGAQIDEAHLLHRSSNAASRHPLFSSTNTIQVERHAWTILSETTPRFERTLGRRIVPGVFIAGLMISFALFGITIYFVKAREKNLQSEAALRSSEELYRTTAESAADAIILIDSESTILSVNSSTERIFGYPTRELVGQSMTFLMPERMRGHHRHGIARYLSSGRRNISWEGVELPGLHKDGHEIPLEISFGEIVKDGKHIFAGIARDITERKRIENSLRDSEERYRTLSAKLEDRVNARTRELEASNQELEAFTYSVAHDLRAPLRHINAFAQLIEADSQSQLSADIQTYIKKMGESALKMARLVDGLLNLALLGKGGLSLELVSLRPVVEEVVTSLKDETKNRDIKWEIEDLPSIECDPVLMRQVFVNLLSNAIKYTCRREKALVQIGRTIIKNQTTIFIRDNGVGFDMRYIGKLFGLFQRLDLAEEFEGTGVGLAMVSRIIQKHHGQIWAEAEEDKGATFYFTVPGMK
ncbi:MAG: sensory box protein [Verrucomicrobiales bacterium]|nr:sensory box protein [Verrucomicrobiales bacterium]